MPAQLAASPDRVSTFASALAATNLLQGGGIEAREPHWDSGLPIAAGVLQVAAAAEVYGEGGDATVFYKVVRGVVRTCKFRNDGRRQIEAFYEEGDIFGFESGTTYRMTAEAVTDCSLITYRRKGIERLAAGNEALTQQLLGYLMEGMTRAQEHALLLGRRSAVERVAVFLHSAAQQSANGRTINLVLTRQDIADYLGLTIETVSRTLSQLERDAIIALPAARQIEVEDAAWLEELSS